MDWAEREPYHLISSFLRDENLDRPIYNFELNMKKVSPFYCKGKSPAAAAVHYTSWEIVGPAKKQKNSRRPYVVTRLLLLFRLSFACIWKSNSGAEPMVLLIDAGRARGKEEKKRKEEERNSFLLLMSPLAPPRILSHPNGQALVQILILFFFFLFLTHPHPESFHFLLYIETL